jgi:class 3 adenylate cyclase
MGETRKLAAILVSDVAGYSRLTGADEDRILARLRTLRSDLIDPTIAVHHGRVVKRTGHGALVEFRSVVDAVRCVIEVQGAKFRDDAAKGSTLRDRPATDSVHEIGACPRAIALDAIIQSGEPGAIAVSRLSCQAPPSKA